MPRVELWSAFNTHTANCHKSTGRFFFPSLLLLLEVTFCQFGQAIKKSFWIFVFFLFVWHS